MPTVIEELVIALKYEVDSKQLDEARKEARAAAAEIASAFDDASSQGQDAADDLADANEDAAGKASEVWTGALREIGAQLTQFAARGAAEVVGFVQDAFSDVRQLDNFAQAVGTTASELDAVQSGLARINIEEENTREAIKTLRENLGELDRLGTGPAADSLGSLGLTLEDFADLGVEDQLKVLADALAGVEDPAKRLSIAIELMGEDGRALLPALSNGADGLGALTDAARDSGQVISDETVAATRQLDKIMGQVEGTLEGVALQLLEALLPQIEDAAVKTEAWLAENEALIQQDLPEIASAIADGLGAVVQVLADVARGFNAARKAAADFGDELGQAVSADQIRAANARGEISDEAAAAALQNVGTRGVAGIAGDSPERRAARGRVAERDRQAAQDAANAEGQAVLESLLASNAKTIENFRRRQAAKEFEKEEKAKTAGRGRGRGRGGKKDKLTAEEREQAELTGLADELRDLSARFGGTDKAVAASIDAVNQSFAKGANQVVARKRGLSTLGGLVGVDLNKQISNDPLSELLGVDALPDVSPAEIAQNRAPQVLTATINNNFNISQEFHIDGADRPDLIPEQITDRFRELFADEVQRVSKYGKVNFAR